MGLPRVHENHTAPLKGKVVGHLQRIVNLETDRKVHLKQHRQGQVQEKASSTKEAISHGIRQS